MNGPSSPAEANAMEALYNRPIVLWVEDVLTREYLLALWENDPRFGIPIAGNRSNIPAVVSNAQKETRRHVFGFEDKDFRKAKPAKSWERLDTGAVFRTTVHEIENYLIEPHALAGCDLNLKKEQWDRDKIRAHMQGCAKELAVWFACCQVISDLSASFRGGFPEHPKHTVCWDSKEASEYISHHAWCKKIRRSAPKMLKPAKIGRELKKAHNLFLKLLSGDGWLREFPGKTLFRDIRDRIYPPKPGESQGSARDVDLAKSVAEWQVAHKAIPHDLLRLRDAMLKRTELLKTTVPG